MSGDPQFPSSAAHRRGVLAVLGLAALARLAWLDSFPPGLWFDEALNGVDAWRSLAGGEGLQWVYPRVFPREPLFVWMLAPVVALLGAQELTLRLVPVGIGIAACGAFYGMLRLGEWRRGPQFAILGAAILACMHWHAHFSRLVFRSNLVPLVSVLFVLVLAAGCRARGRRRRAAAFFAAGGLLGLGFYTYLSWYFFVPVAGLWVWCLLGDCGAPAEERGARPGRGWRDYAGPLGLLAGGGLLVFCPLGLHYLSHPEHLLGRPDALSPLANGWGEAARLVLRNLRDVLLMFHFRGDHVPMHNVPWWPVLGPFWGAAFLIGLIDGLAALLRRPGPPRRHAAAWLGWLVCMSLPSVLSQTDSANMLRNLGATVPTAYFVARGFQAVAIFGERRMPERRRVLHGLLMAGLVVGILLQLGKGLWLHPRVAGIGDSFGGVHEQLADLVNGLPPEEGVVFFVHPAFLGNPVFEFLTLGREDLEGLSLERALVAGGGGAGESAHRILVTRFASSDPLLTDRLLVLLHRQFGEALRVEAVQPAPAGGGREAGPVFFVFRIQASALLDDAGARAVINEFE